MVKKWYTVILLLALSVFPSGEVHAYEGILDQLKYNLMYNTGFFEGENGYSNVTGNFDAQGISFGILQYSLGYELGEFLKEYIRRAPDEVNEIFGPEKTKVLKDIVEKSIEEQKAWGDSITLKNERGDCPGDCHLLPDWHQAFMKMGESKINQQLQFEFADAPLRLTVNMAKNLGIKSTQGLAFVFDQMVQMSFTRWENEGAVPDVRARGNITDKKRLSILLNYIPRNPGIDDGHVRRELIYKGSGQWEDRHYDIAKYEGLTYTSFWR
ncbi:hypothetical protein GK047_12860 [Paenibacillus sp. SYP-B3998]|uniref:Uncharacterized protein n=1 Tax=Paenibacillus sp. SYP-B3998 TaxID=2678564 RepID=A0A6G3ZXF0_9BACL|nr:hypothetical protein [Paenibacillus sp. SYP-B3998]NEW06893.1 hypothetical protein [Paenibacillus sp. SYP-B3998]